MAFDLRKEVEELRKRGASLGLNHDDIDYAVLKSLGGTLVHFLCVFVVFFCGF